MSPLERTLRFGALASLALLVWRVMQPDPAPEAAVVSGASLHDALPRWTMTSFPRTVHVAFTALPARTERDWLKAAVDLGSSVTWSGETGAPALEVTATAEPAPSYLIRGSADGSGSLALRDGSRALATVTNEAQLTVVRTPVVADKVILGATPSGPTAPVPPAPRVGRVALIGPAGWETKFVAAALEESGWAVDTRLTVAPGVGVGGFGAVALDTSRYSTIVAIDAVPDEWAAAVLRFVASGGGLVLSGGAVNARSLGRILPVQTISALERRDTSVVDRSALTGFSLGPAPGSVAMESRGSVPLVLARRAGSGRVIAVGYTDTWRWRMQGGDDSPIEHRSWWSSIVAAAAYATDTILTSAPESAPRAALVTALGAPVAASGRAPRGRFPLDPLLFALVSVALLAEVVSRRKRGLR